MKSFAVEIQGLPPGLLMHRFSVGAQAGLASDTNPTASPSDTPEVQAEAAAYRLESGELYQPAEHIYQALVKAATHFRVRGRGKKTYKDAIKGNVLVEPEAIPHGQTDYAIDARPVRIQRARIMRYRPLLTTWGLSFTLQVIDEKDVPDETLNACLVKAGQAIGIGDYRPRFGRFTVTSFRAL